MDIQYLLFLQNLRGMSGNVFDAFFIEITTYSEALIAFMLLGLVYWCTYTVGCIVCGSLGNCDSLSHESGFEMG